MKTSTEYAEYENAKDSRKKLWVKVVKVFFAVLAISLIIAVLYIFYIQHKNKTGSSIQISEFKTSENVIPDTISEFKTNENVISDKISELTTSENVLQETISQSKTTKEAVSKPLVLEKVFSSDKTVKPKNNSYKDSFFSVMTRVDKFMKDYDILNNLSRINSQIR